MIGESYQYVLKYDFHDYIYGNMNIAQKKLTTARFKGSAYKLSVVIPCHNEDAVIADTHSRLYNVLEGLGCAYEMIFVDDGSTDETRSVLDELSVQYANSKVLALSRNFGHQIAVTAGIDAADGDAVVLIDADLQDPPEIIPDMVERWLTGVDVVYAVRSRREGETWFKLFSAKLFYRLIDALSETEIPHNAGDFRLMDRKVKEALSTMPEKSRFVRGMVAWVGYKQEPIFYSRNARVAGETKYPFKKMIKFAIDGILSFSTVPLKLATIFGCFISLLSFIGILYSIAMRLFGSQWVPGWTLMFICILFLGGVQMIFLGLLGEYIGRIYAESKNRPLYFLEDQGDK